MLVCDTGYFTEVWTNTHTHKWKLPRIVYKINVIDDTVLLVIVIAIAPVWIKQKNAKYLCECVCVFVCGMKKSTNKRGISTRYLINFTFNGIWCINKISTGREINEKRSDRYCWTNSERTKVTFFISGHRHLRLHS